MSEDGARPPQRLAHTARTALWAMVLGDVGALPLFTEDVTGRSPVNDITCREDLSLQLSDLRGGLTDVELEFDELVGNTSEVIVSWRFAGDHTGEVMVNEDAVYEPTGRRLRVSVVSQLTFRDGRISAFAHQLDGDDLHRQLSGGSPTRG